MKFQPFKRLPSLLRTALTLSLALAGSGSGVQAAPPDWDAIGHIAPMSQAATPGNLTHAAQMLMSITTRMERGMERNRAVMKQAGLYKPAWSAMILDAWRKARQVNIKASSKKDPDAATMNRLKTELNAHIGKMNSILRVVEGWEPGPEVRSAARSTPVVQPKPAPRPPQRVARAPQPKANPSPQAAKRPAPPRPAPVAKAPQRVAPTGTKIASARVPTGTVRPVPERRVTVDSAPSNPPSSSGETRVETASATQEAASSEMTASSSGSPSSTSNEATAEVRSNATAPPSGTRGSGSEAGGNGQRVPDRVNGALRSDRVSPGDEIVQEPVSVPAQPAVKPLIRIAVLDYRTIKSLDNKLIDENTGNALSNAVTAALNKSGRFDVIERTRIEAILKEQRFNESGLINPETASELGKLAGVQYVIYGDVENAAATAPNKTLKASVTVNHSAVEVESGRLWKTGNLTGIESEASLIGNPSNEVLKRLCQKAAAKTANAFVYQLFADTIQGKVLGKLNDKGINYVVVDLGRGDGMDESMDIQFFRMKELRDTDGAPILDPETGKARITRSPVMAFVKKDDREPSVCVGRPEGIWLQDRLCYIRVGYYRNDTHMLDDKCFDEIQKGDLVSIAPRLGE